MFAASRWRAFALMKLERVHGVRAQVQALLAVGPDLTIGNLTELLEYLPYHQHK